MERLEAISRGKVQMVMYRDFVKRGARKLKLTGYVRNLADGSVETVAEGEREALEKLITRMKRGSLFSRVENVETKYIPASNEFTAFDIRFD